MLNRAVGPLLIDLGTSSPGGPSLLQGFDVYNLLAVAGLTADLEYLGIDPVSGDLAKFAVTENGVVLNDLIAGGDFASFIAAMIDTSTIGDFAAVFRLDFQDENLPGQGPLQSLFVILQATIVPEPASIALWVLLGVCGLGFGAWRRWKTPARG